MERYLKKFNIERPPIEDSPVYYGSMAIGAEYKKIEITEEHKKIARECRIEKCINEAEKLKKICPVKQHKEFCNDLIEKLLAKKAGE